MGKKIVILNGSPRKTGNTSELVRAFTEGASSAGNEVVPFHIKGKPEVDEAYQLGASV